MDPQPALDVPTPALSSPAQEEKPILLLGLDVRATGEVQRLLLSAGYQVVNETSPDTVAERLGRTPTALLVIELPAAAAGAAQLVRRLKSSRSETEIIAVAPRAAVGVVVEVVRAGAWQFFLSPINPSKFVVAIRECLARYASARDRRALLARSTLPDMARAMTQTADLRANSIEVLPSQAVEVARKSFDAQSATLLSTSPGGEHISVLAHASGHVIGTSPLDLDSIVETTRRLLRAGNLHEPVVLQSDGQDGAQPRVFTPMGQVEADYDAHFTGVLAVCRRHGGRRFAREEIDLIEVFCSHLAVSMENARLYTLARRRISELQALDSIGQVLALAMEPAEVCESVLSGVRQMTMCDMAAILFAERVRSELAPDGSALRTFPPLADDDPLGRAVKERMVPALSHVGGAAPTGRGLGADRPRAGKDGQTAEIGSFISVPLLDRHGVFALLGAVCRDPGRFSPHHVQCLSALGNNAAVAFQHAASFARQRQIYEETILALAAAVDAKDHYTRGHSVQVQRYSAQLAAALGLSAEKALLLRDGALLHDIGKISVPETILNKPGRLTEKELAIIQSHAARGGDILNEAEHLRELVPIVRHHHERLDGKGYPDGLRGEDIPFLARVVAVADSYDAMVSDRSYRIAMSCDRARAILREEAGKQFDAEVVTAFLDLPAESLDTAESALDGSPRGASSVHASR